MKKIFSMFNVGTLKESLFAIVKRFPLSILMIVALSALLFADLHGKLTQDINERIIKAIFSVIIAFFLSLGFYLCSEGMSLPRLKKNILQLLSLLFGLMFYDGFNVNFGSFDNVIFFILTLSGIISFLFFSPFLRRLFGKEDMQKNYYSYFYNTSVVFLISAILGGVLFGLGSIGIGAVFVLFDLKGIVDSKIYGDWAIVALSFITPIFALTKIPLKESFNESNFIQNVFYSFLVKYIAIPFICVYFIILYAYSIKVLLDFKQWPNGEVCWMVIGFSIFGYLIYMFSYIFDETIRFIGLFRKLFPYFVVPQLFMLFYAIYLRIAQYDLTMNRYFIVVFGVWLGVVSLYLIFSNRKYLAYIPLILTVFTIIISIGPWSVYSLPESRQLAMLENNLKIAGISIGGKIIPLKDYEDIKSDLSNDIYSGISYLCEINSCRSIKKLFPEQYAKIEQKSKIETAEYKRNYPTNNWEIVRVITEEIKVKAYVRGQGIYEPDIVSFTIPEKELFPIDSSGYSKILYMDSEKTSSGEHVEYNYTSQSLEIRNGKEILDDIDLRAIIDNLKNKYKNSKKQDLEKSVAVFEISGKKGKYKVIIHSIWVSNPLYTGKPTSDRWYNIYGYVLVR
ncbi:MAG: DUF4153 domain-containing protein [Candidatus Gracilibacteria bacterium]|nr:DUF4153 domain-containing protein [Candidatus Gracilibacteria bacterium]